MLSVINYYHFSIWYCSSQIFMICIIWNIKYTNRHGTGADGNLRQGSPAVRTPVPDQPEVGTRALPRPLSSPLPAPRARPHPHHLPPAPLSQSRPPPGCTCTPPPPIRAHARQSGRHGQAALWGVSSSNGLRPDLPLAGGGN